MRNKRFFTNTTTVRIKAKLQNCNLALIKIFSF